LDSVAWLSVVETAGYPPKRPTVQPKPDATAAELSFKPSTEPKMSSPSVAAALDAVDGPTVDS